MNYFLVIFLFFSLLIQGNANATECIYSYFTEEYINLELCKYYTRESLNLLYAARVKAINEYIAAKIERGELKPKKFEISLHEPDDTACYVYINNTDKACYVETGRIHFTLERLKMLVDACCNPDFKYMEYNYEMNIDAKKAMDKQLAKYAKTSTVNSDSLFFYEHDIWQKDSLKISYSSIGDSLSFILFREILPYGVHYSMPSVIHNRYIIPVLINDNWVIDHFLVYQDSIQIKKFKLPNTDFYDELDIKGYVYDKWVDFCRDDQCMYSYSYNENKFYYFDPLLKKEK